MFISGGTNWYYFGSKTGDSDRGELKRTGAEKMAQITQKGPPG